MKLMLRTLTIISAVFSVSRAFAQSDDLNLPAKQTLHLELEQASASSSSADSSSEGSPTALLPNTDKIVAKYRGHRQSLKFHRRACPYGRIIARSNKIEFLTRGDACNAHYRPCKFCLPPVWTRVSAVVRQSEN